MHKNNHDNEILRILYTNADQLPNKLTELKSRVEIEKPHIIIITEVNHKRTTTTLNLAIFNLNGYQMYQQNVSLQGRGILIYVHETFKDTIEIPSVTDFSEHKLLSVKVGNNADLLVAAIYRSDSGTKQNNENLLNLIREINMMKHSHKLIIGDFNYKQIDWETCYTPKNEHSNEQMFINCIQDVYWNQHITKPTRYREGEEPSTLDLVFTNEEAMIQQVSDQSPLGKSDHSVLLINFQIKHTANFTPRTIHCYDKGDYESMRNDLNINWDAELDSCAVNEQWSKIKEKIRVSVTNHVPSYQTTEKGLWTKATRKEIRKNTDAGSGLMKPNNKPRSANGNSREIK